MQNTLTTPEKSATDKHSKHSSRIHHFQNEKNERVDEHFLFYFCVWQLF